MKTKLIEGNKYEIVKEGTFLIRMVSSGYCSWNPERQNLEIGDVITFEKMAPERRSGMIDVAHFEYKDISGSFSPMEPSGFILFENAINKNGRCLFFTNISGKRHPPQAFLSYKGKNDYQALLK